MSFKPLLKSSFVLALIAVAVLPFTNCASGFDDTSGVEAGASAIDCLNDPKCDNLTLLQLNIAQENPYSLPATNSYSCNTNNGVTTASRKCVDIGGSCNSANFPDNRIYWELTLEDGTPVSDSTTLEELSSPAILAHGKCVDGFYSLRVTFPTNTITANHRLRVFIAAEDEEGIRRIGTTGSYEANIVITP